MAKKSERDGENLKPKPNRLQAENLEGAGYIVKTLMWRIGQIAIRERWIVQDAPHTRREIEWIQSELGNVTDGLRKIEELLQDTTK